MYPLPGTPLKQWVVEQRREIEWERETCPRFAAPAHDDNTGLPCRNSGDDVAWSSRDEHDCCHDCNDEAGTLRSDPSVAAWLAERARRSPVTTDRAALSDQIEPDERTKGTAMSTLISLEQAEAIARGAQIFMQTVRARALRIDQIRRLLATVTERERIALLAEALGATEDEMFAVLEAGTAALRAQDETRDNTVVVDEVELPCAGSAGSLGSRILR